MQRSGIALVLVVFAACRSTESDARSSDGAKTEESLPPPPGQIQRWTGRFVTPTLLVADQIRIEGPKGLLDHLATRADADVHARKERTTKEGFLQEITLVEGAPPVEIRAFLDRFELVAMKRITVLVRPGLVDVVLTAEGDVFVREGDAPERRAPSLRIEGKIER
jgi:hypothetical protein